MEELVQGIFALFVGVAVLYVLFVELIGGSVVQAASFATEIIIMGVVVALIIMVIASVASLFK